ncbi:glycosyltransferase [Pontiella sulfatireligans]|uniref:Phosphatidyl-myo-inositol mannosyltransferase n=1 Tax=Pontiella sulfatireligans TaxID=2750658 RepID=A0A6C2UFX5_9BACT|nr:glycosyltransferase [Pontiella sulfatireligans]VGO18274.1 Phosphatidyl-myo-inositol mannosyltransferase [Pontiella sulfatireligans]
MNLLYITHHTRTRSFSRIGNLAQRLANRGHTITVLCISDVARIGIKDSVADGIRYVEMPDLLPGRLRTGWCPWNAMNRWVWLRKSFNYDLIHIFETRPATIHPLQLVLLKKKLPLVIDWIDWWGRGGIITTNRPRWYQILFGAFETFYEEHFRTLADATTVICTALGHRAEGLGIHPDSIFKVPIGADTEAIPFVSVQTNMPEFGFSENDRIALFSAMDAVMDVELVFSAAKKVKAKCPDFKLVMTGNGAEQLTRRATKMGIGGFFVHLGRLPQEQFVRALTCADVFLLPFSDEVYNRGRWPCKIGDYLAAGRPVISNPVGEVRKIMERHDVGVLTEFNPDAFAGGILQALETPTHAKEMGANARKVAETDLAWDGIIDELERAYEYAVQHQRT